MAEYLRASKEDVTGLDPSPRVRLSLVTPPLEGDAAADGGRGAEAMAVLQKQGLGLGLGLGLGASRVESSPEAVERDGPGGRRADPLRAAEEARLRAESELRAAREEIAALRRQVHPTALASAGAADACKSLAVVRVGHVHARPPTQQGISWACMVEQAFRSL
jgi:hypothetical protein